MQKVVPVANDSEEEEEVEVEVEIDPLPPLTWGPRPLKRRRQPSQPEFSRRVRTVGVNDVSR